LTYTAGGEVVKRFSQKMERLIPKLCWNWESEIHHFVKENDISTLVFLMRLSPSQQKKHLKNNYGM
jgi:GTP-binding protein HflX